MIPREVTSQSEERIRGLGVFVQCNPKSPESLYVFCVCVCVCVCVREREKGRLLPETHNTRFCCLVGHILNSLNVQPFMFLLGGFAGGAYLYIVP